MSKQKQHLCIGRHLDGQMKTSNEINSYNSEFYSINKWTPEIRNLCYHQYNSSGSTRSKVDSCVWIWSEIFKTKSQDS